MKGDEGPGGCVGPGWLGDAPLEALDDEEGPRLAASLPRVIDGHVHLFPDRVFEAVWRWFDRYGWPVRYKLFAPEIVRFLLGRGVARVVALHYAHKPGMARGLNEFMAAICRGEPRVTGLATVFPGEEGAVGILEDAFASGLAGVKLHCHVQCIGPDDPALHAVYELCTARDMPIVMHAGREPKSPHYACDPHALCSAERVARVLADHPKLRLCVPHLGADEYGAYERLLGRFDNLWLDTTMTAADFFPVPTPIRLLASRPDRILYGTDFPNIPYAWDREVKRLAALGLPPEHLEALLGGTAASLFPAHTSEPE